MTVDNAKRCEAILNATHAALAVRILSVCRKRLCDQTEC